MTAIDRQSGKPMKVAVTFDRVGDILDELKRQGVERAEICLVGWNQKGHDGRFPQVFPVEEQLGGESKLRQLIKKAQSMGFQIVCHSNSSDAYGIADTWDAEYVIKKPDGSFSTHAVYSGGRMYDVCPQRAYERFTPKELRGSTAACGDPDAAAGGRFLALARRILRLDVRAVAGAIAKAPVFAGQFKGILGFQEDRAAQPDWPWFEEELSYDNAKLAHALILSGRVNGHQRAFDRGLQTLRWLEEVQTAEDGHFRPVGSNGFYPRGGPRANFDQQPIEAHSMMSACLEAYRATSDARWYEQAQRTFDWFLGWNDLGLELYSSTTGGCRDALHVDRVNQNQGAESTLAFLLSLAEMQLVRNAVTVFNLPAA